MDPRAREIVEALGLSAHPEGGYFREIYRSPSRVRRAGSGEERCALTTIHFLLAAGSFSRWHRVLSDEAWHFAEGSPLELLVCDPGETALRRIVLGPAEGGSRPVAIVPAGCAQAARPLGGYSLVCCSVAPGFEFEDFRLLADEPDAAERIRALDPKLAALL
jgi:predicted cupin superfamily sugar epimerase